LFIICSRGWEELRVQGAIGRCKPDWKGASAVLDVKIYQVICIITLNIFEGFRAKLWFQIGILYKVEALPTSPL